MAPVVDLRTSEGGRLKGRRENDSSILLRARLLGQAPRPAVREAGAIASVNPRQANNLRLPLDGPDRVVRQPQRSQCGEAPRSPALRRVTRWRSSRNGWQCGGSDTLDVERCGVSDIGWLELTSG